MITLGGIVANRAKQIGTRAEVITVAVCKRNGFHYAKRQAQQGINDQGDIHLGDGTDTIIEVKGGKQCLNLQPAKMSKWIAETRAEAKNSDSRMAFLVTQVAGYGEGNGEKWSAHIPWEFYELLTGMRVPEEYTTHQLGETLSLVKQWLGRLGYNG